MKPEKHGASSSVGSPARVINVVQDCPTPHNNALLRALADIQSDDLLLWYWWDVHPDYGFDSSLAWEVLPPTLYSNPKGAVKLLLRALIDRSEKWLVVAWSNPVTKLLLLLSWMTRRRLNFWFDLPDDAAGQPRRRRSLARWFLLHSPSHVFCVGEDAVVYFLNRGFDPGRVTNFPVVLPSGCFDQEQEDEWASLPFSRESLNGRLLFVTGSRMTREKGFDLLVEAVRRLSSADRAGIRVVIVGKGDQEEELRSSIRRDRLTDAVQVIPWLSPKEFRGLCCVADAIVHPARFDAYGGASLMALAVGKPLIAARQAGAAREIVTQGVNGWLYDAEDVSVLADLLRTALHDRAKLSYMAVAMEAYRDASGRSPEAAALRLARELI